MSSTIETRLFIDGKYVAASGNATLDLKNPTTEAHLATVSAAQAADIDLAVAAAEKAFPAWAGLHVQKRVDLLRKLKELLGRDAEKLGKLESSSMGQPLSYFLATMARVNSAFDWVTSLAVTQLGQTSHDGQPGFFNYSIRQPYGPVGIILPWNVSLFLFTIKVVPALAAGNTIIVKSSEKSPLALAALGALFNEAGFPAGVVNIVTGFGKDAGAPMASHPKIRKISFTGSRKSGAAIVAAAAQSNLKRVTLELGGKGPSIICASADVELAAKTCAASMVRNSGQICSANTRVYVHASIFDKFVPIYIKAYTTGVVHGDPLDSKTTNGPLADEIQFNNVLRYIEKGRAEGKVLVGGKRAGTKGYFIEPTVFGEVDEAGTINREEIFGPVSILHKFTKESDAVRRANDTEYGLTSSVYTTDMSQAIRLAEKLETGQVVINSGNIMLSEMPYSGWKASGSSGAELGTTALDDYTQPKAVYIAVKPASEDD